MAVARFEDGPYGGETWELESTPLYLLVHVLDRQPVRPWTESSDESVPVKSFVYRRRTTPSQRPAVYVPAESTSSLETGCSGLCTF